MDHVPHMVSNSTVRPKFTHAYLDQHFDSPVKITLISVQQVPGLIFQGFKTAEIYVVSQVDLHIHNILFALENEYFTLFNSIGGHPVFN